MTKSFQKRLRVAVIALALAVPVDAVILRALSQPTISERAHFWAASLSDEQRSEYIRHGNLPRAYIDALRRSLSRSGVAGVFIDKFADYRKAHPSLSKEQSEFLDQTAELVKSGRLWTPGLMRSDAEKSDFLVKATKLFPNPVDFRALFLVGPSNEPSQAKEPGFNRTAAWLLRIVPSTLVKADEEDWCGCSTSSDWCGSGEHCCDGEACRESIWWTDWVPGCGTMLEYQCNGMCIPSMN